MNEPLVSVVTITRNRGNLLKRCISSVLSQTYKNIEHIVVDGASDDNTDEVMANFKDKRLKYVKLESNWPIKETLDYGISLCSGKYVTFLDSDDEYLPIKIEKQVKLIESLPEDYGFVYCWMTYFDNNTKKTLRLHNTKLRGDVSCESIESPCISGTPTLLFRAEVLREIGGWKSRDEIGIISDWEMCARVCQKYKVDYVAESLVNVYVNHGDVRQSLGALYYDDFYERNKKFHNYFFETYKEAFEKEPKIRAYHYFEMFLTGIKCKRYSKATCNLMSSFYYNPWLTFRKIFSLMRMG